MGYLQGRVMEGLRDENDEVTIFWIGWEFGLALTFFDFDCIGLF